ncbi:hypothetical protein [Kribbella speibonae]|uniref:hypothetical protein n=1 Tax=Kribbella speibonae TaxID=1572660 RepID=UPI0013F3FF50|nr:hypothetical protein [Kribbella speibonae]
MATKEQLEQAIKKLERRHQFGDLTDQQRQDLERAAQQAGSFGNRVRVALDKAKK